jgi:hypothetical protein
VLAAGINPVDLVMAANPVTLRCVAGREGIVALPAAKGSFASQTVVAHISMRAAHGSV